MCERCAALERENASLKAELAKRTRVDVVGRMRADLGVTEHGAKLLLALYKTPGRLVTHDAVRAALPGRYLKSRQTIRDLRSTVCQVRRDVGPGVVETILGRGYMLTDRGVDLIRATMSGHHLKAAA